MKFFALTPAGFIHATCVPAARGIANGMVRRTTSPEVAGYSADKRRRPLMEIHAIGIDLGKTLFSLGGR